MKGKKNNKGVVARRSGQTGSRPMQSPVTRFTSRGAVGQTSEVGNSFFSLFEAGNVFDSNQQGLKNDVTISIDLRAFFAANLFAAYEYFKVISCETTFIWASAPENGAPVMGEIMWVVDKDDRTSADVSTIANRTSLQTRSFDNNNLRRVFQWTPYLIENSRTENVPGAQVDYIQPRNRWLNCDNIANFRFGTLRVIGQCFDKIPYEDNNPIIQWRHRIVIDTKGLKSVIPSSNQFLALFGDSSEINQRTSTPKCKCKCSKDQKPDEDTLSVSSARSIVSRMSKM
jgi:hypothetical protein